MTLQRPIAWLAPTVLGTMLSNWTLLLALELLLGGQQAGRAAHGLWFPGILTILLGTSLGLGLTLISLLSDVLLLKLKERPPPTGRRGWLLSLLTTILFIPSTGALFKLMLPIHTFTTAHLLLGVVFMMSTCATGVRLLLGARIQPLPCDPLLALNFSEVHLIAWRS